MDIQDMKNKVKIWLNDIFADGNYSQLNEIVAENYRDGPNHKGAMGPEFLKARYSALSTMLSNISVEIKDLIGENNKVVVHYIITAIHSGPYLGIEATNKTLQQEGMTIMNFNKEGKIDYTFGIYDRQRIIQQLST